MNVAEFSSEQLLKWLFTTDTLGTRPTTWYVALHNGEPGLDGSTNEVTDSNYARQSVDFTASQPTAGAAWKVTNDADVNFPASAAPDLITHVSVFDALTGGNALAIFKLPVARTVATSGVFSIPLEELVITGE